MAGRGVLPKPDRVRRNRPKKPELALVGELDVPAPPIGLLKATRTWWLDFWRSDLAKALQADTDRQALERLATLYDERERTYRVIRRLRGGPVAHGSQGQLVLHPLAKYLATTDSEIRQLEDRFGLNPRARIALGLQLTQARRDLEDLWDDADADETGLEVIELGEAGSELPAADGTGSRPRRGGR